MDALDKYKKAWSKQDNSFNKISKEEIYKLAYAKSSSIVKWIFIIGIIEFVVLNSIYLFVDLDQVEAEYEKIGIVEFIKYSTIFSYVVLLYFLIQFYINYKRITVIDSTKSLMQKILKTRKTVKNYVLFNLGFLIIIITVMTIASIKTNVNHFNQEELWTFGVIMFFIGILALGFLWGFYQLLYGILLKKLKLNYKELAKLDA
jgi:hypothetical protein